MILFRAFEGIQEGGGVIVFMPWLAKVMPVWSGYDKVKREIFHMADYCRKPVEDHIKTYQEDFDRSVSLLK